MKREVKELKPKDIDWINQKAEEGKSICRHYGFTSEDQISALTLDHVFHIWWNDKKNDRVATENIVNCLGCLFGELLRVKFDSKWQIVIDIFGTDLMLMINTPGNTWDIAPINLVAKRVDSSIDESGFFSAMESFLRGKLEEHN